MLRGGGERRSAIAAAVANVPCYLKGAHKKMKRSQGVVPKNRPFWISLLLQSLA
jgi:hypothetical protein